MAETKAKEKEELNKAIKWVYKEFAAGAAVLAVLYYTVRNIPLDTETLKTPQDRIVFTFRWMLITILPLISAIFDVLNVRGTTNAINPIAGKSEHLVEVPNRILRNGMEQFLLHAIGLLALTTYLDETCMSAIPVLVSMFFVGRVFYSLGFKSSERNRGFGFFITFLPTLITYGYCLYKFATTYLL